jgi:alpha-tubulin suppressor-like RCC1 family protein
MSSTGYLLNGTTLFDGENCSGTVGETCATISLTIPSGHIEFDPTIDIGASIQNSTVTEFHLLADGMISVAADFHLVATDEFNLMGEVELGSVSKSFGFLVGSFPVWGKAELALVATFEAGASIAGSVTGGFEGAGTLRVGARYRSGVWNEEFEPSAAFAAHPVTWDEDLEAHARVGLRIVVSLELYGVGGPFLSGEPHLSASGAIDGAQCQLDIRVFAGVTGEIGLEFVDFIKKILGQIEPFAKDVEGPSATLFEESRPLHQGCDSGEDFVVTTVSAGTIHSCALTTDGTAYCWGRNVEGQLGDGSNNSSNIPVAVAGGLRFASISAGWLHSCGVTTDGNAYCWGGNAWGQLGDNTGTFSFPNVPVAVAGNRSFASVSAANTHTCGLATGGTAFCWGQGWGGEPVPVAGGFASLSAGTQHTCGVTPSGEAACWGSNNWGQLGSPTPVPDINALVYPDSAHNRFGEVVWLKGTFVSISAGADHTCGVTSVLLLPSTYCWGRNWEGQLGLEQFYATSKIPKEAQAPLTLPLGFVVLSSVDVGWNHSCAVAAITFRAYCWGENAWGQLGIGSLAYKAIPAEVEGNIDFASISAGASHTCGVTSNGHAYCWGSNGVPGSGGQLGDGTFESSLVPKQVAHP